MSSGDHLLGLIKMYKNYVVLSEQLQPGGDVAGASVVLVLMVMIYVVLVVPVVFLY